MGNERFKQDYIFFIYICCGPRFTSRVRMLKILREKEGKKEFRRSWNEEERDIKEGMRN